MTQRFSKATIRVQLAALLSMNVLLAGTVSADNEGPCANSLCIGNPEREAFPEVGNGPDEDPCDHSSNSDPLDLSSGEYKLNRSDLVLPGMLGPFVLSFHYRSQRMYDGHYGYGWYFPLELRLFPLTNGDVLWRTGTGEHVVFADAGGSTYTSPSVFHVTLVQAGGGGWDLIEHHGTIYTFSPEGLLETIADRAGNTIQFAFEEVSGAKQKFPIEGAGGKAVAYDYRISQIFNDLGHSLTFSYYSAQGLPGYGRLEQVTDSFGRTVSYTYDAEGNLETVHSPVSTYQDISGLLVTKPRVTTYTYSTGFKDTRQGAPESPLDHNLLTITDDRGYTQLVNYYDGNDRVTAQDFYGGTNRIVYRPTGVDEIDTEGHLHSHVFDIVGNLSSTTTDGRKTEYQYNLDRELTQVKYPKGNVVNVAYVNGNIEEVRRQEAVSSTGTDIVSAFTYDTATNDLKTATDPEGHTVTLYYDFEEAGLGVDINGDGSTSQTAGNVIKVEYSDATKPDGGIQAGIADVFWYDDNGRIIKAIAPNGRVREWTYYDSIGAPQHGLLDQAIIDPSGLNLTTKYTYDAYGFIATILNPRSKVTTFISNPVGEITEVMAPEAVHARFEYDANGNVVLAEVENRDENGVLLTPAWIQRSEVYDAWNRRTSMSEDVEAGVQRTRSWLYDALGRVSQRTSPEGRVEAFTYDPRGILVSWVRGYGTAGASQTTFVPDPNGLISQWIDGNFHTTTYEYDKFDRLTAIEDAEGDRFEVDYDKRSLPVIRSVIDPTLGLMTEEQLDWDELGRITKRRQINTQGAGSSEAWMQYDKSSLLSRAYSPKGVFTKFGYDSAGRMTFVEDPEGNRRDWTLDENGNPTVITTTDVLISEGPLGGFSGFSGGPGPTEEVYEEQLVYDDLDRPIEYRRIDRDAPAHQLVWSYGYDSRSLPVSVTDPVSRVLARAFDLAGRLRSEAVDQTGSALQTTYGYDQDDLLTSLQDPDGFDTDWQYDPLGRVQRIDYETGLFERFRYDAVGNLLSHTALDGLVTTQSFHDNDRLDQRSNSHDSKVEEFSWNALGALDFARVLQSGVPTSEVIYGYDGYGRVSSEVQEIGADAYAVGYGYDVSHNLASVAYPGGFTVTNTFDSIERLDTISDQGGAIASYEWAGPVRVRSRTTGTTEARNWDGLRRVKRVGGAGTIHDLKYGHDDLGRRTWMQRKYAGNRGDSYAYDGGSRLQQVWYDVNDPTNGTAGYADHLQIALTDGEDRSSTTLNGVPTTYNASGADPLHRYLDIGGATRLYDGRGNLVDDGVQLFEYDAWNRLTEVSDTGGVRANYDHDALGRRIAKVEGGTTTHYVHGSARLLAEYEDTGGGPALSRRYVHGLGLDEVVALEDGQGTRYWVYQDVLGSVTAITDAGGTLVERYTYDAFGVPAVTDAAGAPITGAYGRPASSVGNSLWFTGARWDAESGHYHMRARQYEPGAGRFVSRDPLGYIDGPNPYSYARSGPTNWMDPLGLEAQSGPDNGPRRSPKAQKAHERALAAYTGPDQIMEGHGLFRGYDGPGNFIKNYGSAKFQQAKQRGGTFWRLPGIAAAEAILLGRDMWGLGAHGDDFVPYASTFQYLQSLDDRGYTGFSWIGRISQDTIGSAGAAIGDGGSELLYGENPGAGLAMLEQGLGDAALAALGGVASARSFGRTPGRACAPRGRLPDNVRSVDDILRDPDSLAGGILPEQVQDALGDLPDGWQVESLGRGTHKGQGFALREYTSGGNPTGQLIRWHPGGGHHGPDPYWRVSSGTGGKSDPIY